MTQYCKMLILLKFTYAFNIIPVKVSADFFFFVELDKLILMCTWKWKKQGIARIISKNNKLSRLTVLGSKTDYQAVGMKSAVR